MWGSSEDDKSMSKDISAALYQSIVSVSCRNPVSRTTYSLRKVSFLSCLISTFFRDRIKASRLKDSHLKGDRQTNNKDRDMEGMGKRERKSGDRFRYQRAANVDQ